MIAKYFQKNIYFKNILKLKKSSFNNRRIFKNNFYKFSSIKLDEEGSDPDFKSQSNFEEDVEQTINQIEFNSDVDQQQLISDIKQAIQESNILLFMKGNPDMPRCGYSKLMVELLKFYDIEEYGFVDVLQFTELRPAIKEATEWMTFPQLYRKGEFLGGSDIVFELHQENKLKDALVGEKS